MTTPAAAAAPVAHEANAHANQVALLLDAVLGRGQRQPLQVRLHGHGDLPAPAELDAAGHGGPGDRGAVHPAVPAVLGHLGPADRQVRQDEDDPLRQEPRDRDHAARGLGLRAGRRGGAAGLRVPHGAALHAVRAGQVRLPAAGARFARADRRQRHGRDGHLRRNPAGAGGGRAAGGGAADRPHERGRGLRTARAGRTRRGAPFRRRRPPIRAW